MRLVRLFGVASALILATATLAAAQPKSTPGGAFEPGATDIGPVIGIGGIGDAGISIGGRFEHGIKALPDLGNGVLSIAVSLDHYTFDQFCDGCGFSYTPIGVTANYHFHLDDRRWDPFFGLGLGDYFVSEPDACHGLCHGFNSGIYVIGRLGVRYYWQPKLALYADVGSGAGSLHLGVMFKIK